MLPEKNVFYYKSGKELIQCVLMLKEDTPPSPTFFPSSALMPFHFVEFLFPLGEFEQKCHVALNVFLFGRNQVVRNTYKLRFKR